MDKVWKKFERVVANVFNTSRTALSGGNSKLTRSDTLSDTFFIEAKYRSKLFIHSLFQSTKKLAKQEQKIPLLALKQANMKGFYLVLHVNNKNDLVEFCKKYLAEVVQDDFSRNG